MNEKILQIIPAPANLMYGFDGEEAHQKWVALYERENISAQGRRR